MISRKSKLAPTEAVAEIASQIVQAYLDYAEADALLEARFTSNARKSFLKNRRDAVKHILELASSLGEERERQRSEAAAARRQVRRDAWEARPALDPASEQAAKLYAELEAAHAEWVLWTGRAANDTSNNPNKHRGRINQARRKIESAQFALRLSRLPTSQCKATCLAEDHHES